MNGLTVDAYLKDESWGGPGDAEASAADGWHPGWFHQTVGVQLADSPSAAAAQHYSYRLLGYGLVKSTTILYTL